MTSNDAVNAPHPYQTHPQPRQISKKPACVGRILLFQLPKSYVFVCILYARWYTFAVEMFKILYFAEFCFANLQASTNRMPSAKKPETLLQRHKSYCP